MISKEVVNALKLVATEERRKVNEWFFKTEKGEYGYGDISRWHQPHATGEGGRGPRPRALLLEPGPCQKRFPGKVSTRTHIP